MCSGRGAPGKSTTSRGKRASMLTDVFYISTQPSALTILVSLLCDASRCNIRIYHSAAGRNPTAKPLQHRETE